MAYVTQQEMIDRFGEDELIQLTDRTGNGTIDADVLERAIDDASAIMDGYIGARYVVPLSDPVPDIVSVTAADLVRCQLYDSGTVDKAEARCERAMKWLRDVAAGRAMIPGVEASEDVTVGAPAGARRGITFSNECLDKMPGEGCA